MRKIPLTYICIIALVAFAAWAPDAGAYPAFSPTNCSTCHSMVFAGGAGSIGHQGHNWLGLPNGCNTCHISIGDDPPMANCVDCHVQAGLVTHHESANEFPCANCHPGLTPDPENTPVPGYATITAATLDTCDGSEELFGPNVPFGAGSFTVSLDNDGDLLYDGDDPDCGPPPECVVDADCDDGQFCNGAETCDTATGTCLPGTPPDCDDAVDCTVDTCDEVNDVCVNTPDDASCDDNNVCNGLETCDPILDCQAGTPLVCDDGDLCTDDSCDPIAGCVFTPVECPPGQQCDPGTGQCVTPPECVVDADCDDGQFCNGAETCDTATGTCLPGTPPDCDDGVTCTVDTCDEVNDTCVNTPDDTACPDDGQFCTGLEICDPIAGCVSTGDPCPAGTVCNEDTDTCDVVTDKVTICHIPPGNPAMALTLRISAESVADHLAHGDILGPCP